jgi:hypothetical protein
VASEFEWESSWKDTTVRPRARDRQNAEGQCVAHGPSALGPSVAGGGDVGGVATWRDGGSERH